MAGVEEDDDSDLEDKQPRNKASSIDKRWRTPCESDPTPCILKTLQGLISPSSLARTEKLNRSLSLAIELVDHLLKNGNRVILNKVYDGNGFTGLLRLLQDPPDLLAWRNTLGILCGMVELAIHSKWKEKVCVHLFEADIIRFVLEAIVSPIDNGPLQALACKLMCTLLGSEKPVISISNDGGQILCDKILEVLPSLLDDEDFVEWALRLLALVFEGSIDVNSAFLEDAENGSLIPDLVKCHMENVNIAKEACRVIRRLSLHGDLYGSLFSSRLHEFVLGLTCHFLRNRSFQRSVYKTLATLSGDETISRDLVILNCTENVLLHLKSNKDDPIIQLAGLEMLSNFAQFQSKSTKVNEWLGHVFDALVSHQDDVHMQEGACRVLTKLLELRPEVIDYIGEEEDQLPLHSTVLAAMNIHLTNSHVFQAACSSIYVMATSSMVLQKYLVAKGAYISIVNRMREAMSDAEVQEWGCRALRALCFNNIYQKEMLVTYATLSDLTSLLDEHQDACALMEEVIGLLACLASDVQLVCRQCLLEQVHLKVLHIISQEEGTVALYEVAFELFASFSSSEERDLLVEGKVLTRVEELMRACKKEANLQRKGCMVIQVLADSSLAHDKELCLKLITAVKYALNNFPTDTDLLTEALVTLHVLSSMGPLLTKQLVEEKIYEPLFVILEKFPSSQLSTLASECLCDLCWKQDSKDDMLRSACRSGIYRVVDLLLKLGADPDAGPVNDTALCIVIKDRDFDLAELLMSAGASSLETPLKLSLSGNSDRLAGMLLRKIGLDEKNNVLAWSGLELKELKLEYFFGSGNFVPIDSVLNLNDTAQYVEKIHAARKRRTTSLSRTRWQNDAQNKSPMSDRPVSPILDSVDESVFVESEAIPTEVERPVRPRTLSGAVLPFSRTDPRIGPQEADSSTELPLQLGSPSVEKYYPGFPDSTLFSDPGFGQLLSSGSLTCVPNSRRGIPRCSSQALPDRHNASKSLKEDRCSNFGSSTGDSSDDNGVSLEMEGETKRKTLTHFRSTGSLIKKEKNLDCRSEPSGPVIKSFDLSCNLLTNLNVMLSSNVLMRHLVKTLEKLDVSQNRLTYIPQDLCKALENLRQLYVSENSLIDFPYELLCHKVLEVVDLSHNRVCELLETKLECDIYLSRLNISYNLLSKMPKWISLYFPALSWLSFAFNRIQTLPSKPLALYQLRELYLCGNRIKVLPAEFLYDCPLLKKLDLSRNELTTLPEATDLSFCSVQVLNLSHNLLASKEPFYVPPFVLRLPCLRILNISHNQITQVPPATSWRSNVIEELNFDHNSVRKINIGNDVAQWSLLQRFTVSNNKLEEIPQGIGLLVSLRCLNVSNNPKVTKIPDELGRLRNLIEFPVTGLKLSFDPSVNLGKPAEIVSFLHWRLKLAVPYHRIKLMLVGLGGRGKSTLLRQLRSLRQPSRDVATLGVKVQDWLFRQPKSHATRNSGKKYPPFVVSTWDFAGQEDFYSTHQCFLSKRALYLAVFDASRGSKELELLRPWLLNIQAGAPGAAVILVGTHADEVRNENSKDFLKDLNRRVKEFIRSPGFPDIKGHAIINCSKESKFIEQLRCKIYDAFVSLDYKGQPIVGQMVPKSYVQLEDLLKKKRVAMQQLGVPPILRKAELVTLATEKGIQLDKEELIHAMKFLNESGVIIFFDESKAGLDDLFFIDPEWLCQVLAKVVTVRQVNPFISEDGILLKSDLQRLNSNGEFAVSFDESYLRLFRKFEIILPLDEERNLVPCRLPNLSPTEADILLDSRNLLKQTVCRRYVFPYIPIGFWSRLITRMMLFADAVFQRELLKPQKDIKENYWQDGIYKQWNEECFFLVCTSKVTLNAVDIVVPTTKSGYTLLGHIVDHMETLLEEWYPGLCEFVDTGDDTCAVKRLAPCRSCPRNSSRHHFLVSDCIKQSFESDYIYCPVEDAKVPLADLTPDVVMEDLGEKYLIAEDEIQLKQDTSNLLGGGSYGSVYKTRYNNQNVAFKVFGGESLISRHRQLRREVNILRGLRHPSLISMVGVCLRPRTLVMELAPMGALSNILKSGKPLSRTLQYRISHQVVDGLAFLHRNSIVYRDLKPSNILLFSLSSGILINAKIADYGISQYATPLGLASNEGTGYYRAPEIEKGNTGYNTEVDIYSLGVTLYDIVTTGAWKYGPNADNMLLTSRTYKAIATFGCPPWPDMEDLIRRCIQEQPEMRPTSEEILNRLSSADFLCLRLDVRVCKEQSIECMVVRKASNPFRDKLEVWVGSGDSDGLSQISWFDPTSYAKPSCRGTVINEGRILCMTTWYNDTILLGTRQGYIVLFDAETHRQLRTLSQLSSPVLCMKVLSTSGHGDYLLAGLADGQLAIYSALILAGEGAATEMLTLGNSSTPVACVVSGRKRIFLGVGNEVVVLWSDNYTLDKHWRACDEDESIVSSIALGRRLWTASKGSHLVHGWEFEKGVSVETVDCLSILSAKHPTITNRDSRVISIFLNCKETLWIGTGKGHIILIDITSKCVPIAVFSRHVSSVRCFASCSGRINEKPLSLVLSGGLGFKDQGSEEDGEKGHDDGCVLIWESDLAKQHTHLENERKTRGRRATEVW